MTEAGTTDRETEKEEKAAEAAERIKSGTHWNDWMYVGEGFVVGRAKAMRKIGTNNPIGSAYNRAFGDWMDLHSWARGIDKTTRNHLFWCADHRTEIEEWRSILAQNERDLINHPSVAKRRYEAAHKLTAAKHPNAAPRETKTEALIRDNARLWDENAKLKRQIEAGEGSLFDLLRDSIESIVNTIAGNVLLGRFESLQRAMTKKLAELKNEAKIKQAKAG